MRAYSVAAFFVEWFKNRHVFLNEEKKAAEAMRRGDYNTFFLLQSMLRRCS
jgi:hypothetical protein